MMSFSTYRENKLLNRTESLLKDHTAHRKRPCRLKMIILLAAVLFFITPASALAASGEDIVDTAYEYLGYPYAYQCAGPDAFDCSGFVWYVFNQAGIDFELRIGSAELAAQNTAIYDAAELQKGDILFFGSSPSAISHWGIYAGDGQVIHAYNAAVGVVLTPLEAVIPAFCYACRIDELVDNEDLLLQYLNQHIDLEQIPPQFFTALANEMPPLLIAIDGEKLSREELDALLADLDQALITPNNINLLQKFQLLATVIAPQQKYDPEKLYQRIVTIAQNSDAEARHDEYISLIVYSLPLAEGAQTD